MYQLVVTGQTSIQLNGSVSVQQEESDWNARQPPLSVR
jgi:hypothetical protein